MSRAQPFRLQRVFESTPRRVSAAMSRVYPRVPRTGPPEDGGTVDSLIIREWEQNVKIRKCAREKEILLAMAQEIVARERAGSGKLGEKVFDGFVKPWSKWKRWVVAPPAKELCLWLDPLCGGVSQHEVPMLAASATWSNTEKRAIATQNAWPPMRNMAAYGGFFGVLHWRPCSANGRLWCSHGRQ